MKNTNTLIASGALTIAIGQILAHYLNFSDPVNGVMMGVGIGLLSVALIAKGKKVRS